VERVSFGRRGVASEDTGRRYLESWRCIRRDPGRAMLTAADAIDRLGRPSASASARALDLLRVCSVQRECAWLILRRRRQGPTVLGGSAGGNTSPPTIRVLASRDGCWKCVVGISEGEMPVRPTSFSSNLGQSATRASRKCGLVEKLSRRKTLQIFFFCCQLSGGGWADSGEGARLPCCCLLSDAQHHAGRLGASNERG